MRSGCLLIMASALVFSCGGPSGEDEGTAPENGMGQVLEAGEALNSIAAPPVPTGVIRDAREAVDATNERIGAADSLVGAF